MRRRSVVGGLSTQPAVHAVRASVMRNPTLDDLDLPNQRITIAGPHQRLDELPLCTGVPVSPQAPRSELPASDTFELTTSKLRRVYYGASVVWSAGGCRCRIKCGPAGVGVGCRGSSGSGRCWLRLSG